MINMEKIITVTLVLIVSAFNLSGAIVPIEESPVIIEEEPKIEAIDRITYWKEHPEESPLERAGEIGRLSAVADAVVPGDYTDCKIAVMQCILNRTKQNGFPNTIKEVCNQPYQWEGYTPHSQGSYKTSKLAEQILDQYRSEEITVLLIPRNCVYMCKTPYGLEFRADWDITDETELTLIKYVP